MSDVYLFTYMYVENAEKNSGLVSTLIFYNTSGDYKMYVEPFT